VVEHQLPLRKDANDQSEKLSALPAEAGNCNLLGTVGEGQQLGPRLTHKLLILQHNSPQTLSRRQSCDEDLVDRPWLGMPNVIHRHCTWNRLQNPQLSHHRAATNPERHLSSAISASGRGSS